VTRTAIPSVPGILDTREVRATAASIAAAQEPDGAVPWFPGGHVDPWDHVECAMAMLVGGEVDAAERAYGWSAATQRPDGSWPMKVTRGVVEDASADTNMCAYLAVGVWHHWLVRADTTFLSTLWPSVRRALDFVTGHQLSFGGMAWARDASGAVAESALLAGSSSIYHSLTCGLALAALMDEPQPEWELAAGRLQHALRCHEERFDPKSRYSMDWYYPVLGGALRGQHGKERIRLRWADFVVTDLGIRCVDDHPWVTGAETCELVLALDALGQRDRALELFRSMQHLRHPDGSYWTGYVYPDDARWPEERSTWTAAAVLLATDSLSRTTPGADLFRGSTLRSAFTEFALECECIVVGQSTDRVTGSTARPG
jgi:hypothetical protein